MRPQGCCEGYWGLDPAGYLDRRNECAHPSDYFPDLNMTLAYITDLVDRIKRLRTG
jgi:hypothetical protein